MKIVHILFMIVATTCFGQMAAAQYEWLDHNGQHVFSDRMPPADIPERNILRQPAAADPLAATRTTTSAADTNAGSAPDPGAQESELERKKQEMDEAERARREAEQRQQRAARVDNCERARRSKRTLESGVRMARVNEAGERIVMDDAQRAAEAQRADAIIASDCGDSPRPQQAPSNSPAVQ